MLSIKIMSIIALDNDKKWTIMIKYEGILEGSLRIEAMLHVWRNTPTSAGSVWPLSIRIVPYLPLESNWLFDFLQKSLTCTGVHPHVLMSYACENKH